MIRYVKEKGGIEYATQQMEKYYRQSLEMIDSLPASDYRTSLSQLVQFTIERKA